MDRPVMDEETVAVLGAGISGLVAASVLLSEGVTSVVVIDEYSHVGGNHIHANIGDYTFDVGSLIFQDDSPLLLHFPELLQHYVPVDPAWSRVTPQGRVTEYPFSLRDDFLGAGLFEMLRITASVIAARIDRRPMRNAYDFARHSLGSRFLRRSGLEHYMERFCGCPIREIDLAFARSRMTWIRDQTTARAIATRFWRALWRIPIAKENTQMVRPRSGFGELYAPVVSSLEARGVRFVLGEKLRSVESSEKGFEVRTASRTERVGRVVSTIPIVHALELAGVPAPQLPTVTLVSLFYSFMGHREFTDAILYNFTREARWKRLTVYSDFYGEVDGRQYFTVEVVAGPEGSGDCDEADIEFRSHVAGYVLLDGDLRLEGSHVLKQAYPVYTQGSAALAANARQTLRGLGIESLGRQGAFQYQPTARVSTLEAEAGLGSPRP